MGSGILHGQSTSCPSCPTYRFNTNLGNIDVLLTPNVAPQTVANFLSYVNAGYYNNSIFHRLVNGFVVQGGGYQYVAGQTAPNNAVAIPQGNAIPNEFNVTNGQGTIAMALTNGSNGTANPASATSEWFFNLVGNGGQLDSQLFTVFGSVVNSSALNSSKPAGLAVLNNMNLLTAEDLDPPYDVNFSTCPVTNGGAFLLVNSIVPLPTAPPTGFVSAATFASSSLTGISPGEVISIFGTGLSPTPSASLTVGSNGVVTNSLGGTQVFFNGTAAPITYTGVNPATGMSQVNVVAPYSIGSLPTVSVSLAYNGVTSYSTLNFPVKPANPAIFTLNGSGTGDAAIERYPAYDIISAANPASVGDVLILFAEGYGAATAATALPDGTIVTSKLPVPAAAVTVLIDGQPLSSGNILYLGGAPDLINGVLQVNFTVPQLAPGSHQIQLQVGSPARTSPTAVTLATK